PRWPPHPPAARSAPGNPWRSSTTDYSTHALLTLDSRGHWSPCRLGQRLYPLSAKSVGFRHLDRAKPHGLPGLDLPDATDVERAHRRALRVAACRPEVGVQATGEPRCRRGQPPQHVAAPEASPLETAQTAAQVRRAGAERRRHVEAAGEGDVDPDTGPGGADADAGAGRELERGPLRGRL